MRKLALLCVLVIAGSCGVYLYNLFRSPEGDPKDPAPEAPQETKEEKIKQMAAVNAEISRSLRFNQNEATLLNDPMDYSQLSEMALVLDDPYTEEREAQIALHDLLGAMTTTVYRGHFPAGLNVEITNALLGDNPRKVGYMPMDSPRINENGELIDKFGTPYWFHSETSTQLRITSAGPDKLLHTEDDISYPDDE